MKKEKNNNNDRIAREAGFASYKDYLAQQQGFKEFVLKAVAQGMAATEIKYAKKPNSN